MVVMDIPKLQPDRTVRLVRVTIRAGVVVCKDDPIRMELEKLKPIGVRLALTRSRCLGPQECYCQLRRSLLTTPPTPC
jgi:hypothetical protein